MYRKDSRDWLKHLDFILLDLICLQVAYVLAYGLSGYGFNPYDHPLYRSVAFLLVLTDLVIIFIYGTMNNVLKRGYYRDFIVTIHHSLILGASILLELFVVQQGNKFSRLTLILTFGIYAIVTYVMRNLWKKFVKRKMSSGEGRKLLIITVDQLVEETIDNIRENNYARYSIDGIVIMDKNRVGEMVNGVKVVSDSENIYDYVTHEWVDEIFISFPLEIAYPVELVNKLTETGVIVHLNLARVTKTQGKQQFVEKLGNYTVLTTSVNYASSFQLFLKRVIDIIGGLAGCIITGILCLFVAPAIKKESPGPIFFSQERVGKNGKPFKIYKFRSMYMDAEERKAALMSQNKLGSDMMFKMDFDPRVIGNVELPDGTRKTGIGDFIRRTSIDEFPQFFNVLKGDMSIVGTRPPLTTETSLYELHHKVRLAIKPGITGLWQVSGRSDITDFEEVVRLDREYISGWNIGLDIKILVKTALVVLKREGSV